MKMHKTRGSLAVVVAGAVLLGAPLASAQQPAGASPKPGTTTKAGAGTTSKKGTTSKTTAKDADKPVGTGGAAGPAQGTGASTSTSSDKTTPPGDAADMAFRKGNDLFRAEKFAEAEAAYEAAFEMKKTHDIAANLGYAEIQQKKFTEAAAHLSFAVRNWPPTGKADKREFAVQTFETARKEVGALRVIVARAGAQVLLDGKAVGTSPLEDSVFVDPGSHTLTAELAGFEAKAETVDAKAGAAQDVTLTLTPVKPKDPPKIEPVVDETAVKRRKIALIAGGAAVGAGVIIGAVLAGVSNATSSDADAKYAELEKAGGSSACKLSAPLPGCSEMNDLYSKEASLANGAFWTFITTGVVGAGAAIYGFSKAPMKMPASAPKVGAAVHPKGAWMTVEVAW